MTVPPVPAPAIKASTLPDDGLEDDEGVDTTASIISGPVVYSCARGLLTLNKSQHKPSSHLEYLRFGIDRGLSRKE